MLIARDLHECCNNVATGEPTTTQCRKRTVLIADCWTRCLSGANIAAALTATDGDYQRQTVATVSMLTKQNERLERALNALQITKERMDKVESAVANVSAAVQRGDPATTHNTSAAPAV